MNILVRVKRKISLLTGRSQRPVSVNNSKIKIHCQIEFLVVF
jgi:hypothetical protein